MKSRVLNRKQSNGKTKPLPSRPAVGMDDVRTWLSAQSKDSLVKLLMEQALDRQGLRRELFFRAANKSAKRVDLNTYKHSIDQAVDNDGFVEYREAYSYTSGIEESVAPIAELLKAGHSSEAIELAEYALHALEEAMESVDDSDGYMGMILDDLQETHLKACRKAKPEPEELARRLFSWELSSDWSTFSGAVKTYAGVLGKKGLAEYRRVAEAEWAALPALKPDSKDNRGYGKRYGITRIMETLAGLTGDVEALVSVKKRDLSSSWNYLIIAEEYQKAGKHNLALEWAENGVRAFPKKPDSRLREFLANQYHRRKRHGEAMDLIWAEFIESPGLNRYQNLKGHADRAGKWSQWRGQALKYLRESIAKEKRRGANRQWSRFKPDHSVLVEIFLWEKEVEAAWREAKKGGCSDHLWMELAKKREAKHPQDSLPIYMRQIEPILDRKNNDAYRDAVRLLKKICKLMNNLKRKKEFMEYLASLRANHNPKRNFMKLLDGQRWE